MSKLSNLSRIVVAGLALVLLAIPALAHENHAQPAAASAAITATGMVTELIVENRLTGQTYRYLGLRLDDGRSFALAGGGLDALITGTRVDATGSLAGQLLTVAWFTPVAGGTVRAATAQSPKTIAGTLAVYHMDFFEQGRGEYGLAVRDASGQITMLNVAAIPDTLQPNMQVSVDGATAADGKSMDVDKITILAGPPAQIGVVSGAPVTNTVLVIPIRFTDPSPGPYSGGFTAAAANTEFQTNVAPYYQDVSYGQQLLNITVACTTTVLPGCAGKTDVNGWLVSGSPTPAGCDINTMASLAEGVATSAGYDASIGANKFVYVVLPSNNGCGWAGLAYVGWGLAYSANVNGLWVYGHELGHNFGLWHAGSVGCGTQVLGGNCGVSEYGDPFDVMGNIRQMHFNAMQKSRLNWIPGTSVKTHVLGTQTYQLSPIETGGQSTYAVKIPTSNANRTYWVEFRQPLGYDAPLSSLPNLGAQIRVSTPFETVYGGDDTEILDTTPGSSAGNGGFDDAALLATAPAYVDTSTGVTIKVNSATSGAGGVLSVSVTALDMPQGKADFDGDGKGDIVWGKASTGEKQAWLMNGGSTASSVSLLTDPNWSITQRGDFNGDGKSDLLWRNVITGETAMWLMNGTATLASASLLTSQSWSVINVGDFNGDGKTDLLWRNSVTGEVVIWLMNGTTFIGGGTLLTDRNWLPTHVADFNGDGKSDILWRNTATGQIVVWIMNGATFVTGGPIMSDPAWVVTHVADFNGDGKADLVWRRSTGETALWLMNGGTLVAGTGLLSDPNWYVAGVADLNGDGNADILWRNSATGSTAAWLMNGTTLLGGAGLLGSPWVINRTGDFNGDNKADILWTNPSTGQKVMWLMNGLSPGAGYTLSSDPNWSILP